MVRRRPQSRHRTRYSRDRHAFRWQSSSLSSSQSSKRRDQDVIKLMMSRYKVEMIQEDGRTGFLVDFKGPANTSYEHGRWNVRVELPAEYPFKSPSIGFANRIFHPNVDEASGSVCLDVINQAWSPMYSLINVFEVFLPQLLTYPNPNDPLNGEAASLLLRDPKAFDKRVREMVARHAPDAEKSPTFSSSSPNSDQLPVRGSDVSRDSMNVEEEDDENDADRMSTHSEDLLAEFEL